MIVLCVTCFGIVFEGESLVIDLDLVSMAGVERSVWRFFCFAGASFVGVAYDSIDCGSVIVAFASVLRTTGRTMAFGLPHCIKLSSDTDFTSF